MLWIELKKKVLSTYITLERLLPCVGPHVLIEATFLTEGLVALRTLVWLFLGCSDKKGTQSELMQTQGSNFHAGWYNVDINSAGLKSVQATAE